MRTKGTEELVSLRMTIYLSTDPSISRSFPPEVFLPDTTIKLLLDRFALINTKAALQDLAKGQDLLTPHLDRLWDKLVELQATFGAMRTRLKAKAKAREAERRAQWKVEAGDASESVASAGEVSQPTGSSRKGLAGSSVGGEMQSMVQFSVIAAPMSFQWQLSGER